MITREPGFYKVRREGQPKWTIARLLTAPEKGEPMWQAVGYQGVYRESHWHFVDFGERIEMPPDADVSGEDTTDAEAGPYAFKEHKERSGA